MKYLPFLFLGFFLLGCNLAEWNQYRLNKKFKRNRVNEYTYKSDSTSIHYFKGGQGPVLFLIHGFGGDAQITWQKTILDLSKNYTIVAPDLLWFGQSISKKTPSLNTQVNSIFKLLEHLKINECHIAGVSYGGFVTLGLVQKNPDVFSKVCIVDSPGMTYDTSLLKTMCDKFNVVEPADIFVPKNNEEVRRLFDFAFHEKKIYTSGILQDAYELYFSKNHNELTTLIRTLPKDQEQFFSNNPDSFPETLILWGENDEVFPKNEGEKLAKFIKCDFKTIENAGHAPMIEKSKEFNAILKSFLK